MASVNDSNQEPKQYYLIKTKVVRHGTHVYLRVISEVSITLTPGSETLRTLVCRDRG